jgi:tRNA(adenine34) deaminase
MATAKKKSAAKRKTTKKWVAKVTTDSTHPPDGLFTKSANTISRTLASKKVSPKGPASGMRMLNYFINRGGRGLTQARKAELEKAKKLLSAQILRAKQRES